MSDSQTIITPPEAGALTVAERFQAALDLGDEQPVLNGTNDVVNINSISGPTTIDAGQGNDVIRVNFNDQGKQTFVSGIDGELTLHGQQGSDRYEIGLAGQISSRINVFDQSGGDPGHDLRSL